MSLRMDSYRLLLTIVAFICLTNTTSAIRKKVNGESNFNKSSNNDENYPSRPKKARIVGGNEAEPGQFPFAVSIFSRSINKSNRSVLSEFSHTCGGSIINNKFIITAARCFYPNETLFKIHDLDFLVHVGVHRIQPKLSPRVVNHTIKNVYCHPEFKGIDFRSDIAIVELNDQIQFESFEDGYGNAQSIKLNSQHDEQNFIGYYLTVSGWGLTSSSDGKFISATLRYASYQIDEPAYIKPPLSKAFFVTKEHFYLDSSSEGDHGSALFFVDYKLGDPIYTQVGILSQSPVEHSISDYSLYTSVKEHVNWIKDTVEGASNFNKFCSNIQACCRDMPYLKKTIKNKIHK